MQAIPDGAEMAHHRGGNLLAGGVARELVGGREEKAFESFRARSEIGDQRGIPRGAQKILAAADSLLLKLTGDVEDRPAFGNGDDVDENLAARDLPENLPGVDLVVEQIFARLKRAAEMPVAEERKGEAVANNVILAEYPGNAPARGAARNVDKNSLRAVPAIGTADLRFEPSGACS